MDGLKIAVIGFLMIMNVLGWIIISKLDRMIELQADIWMMLNQAIPYIEEVE